MLQNKTNGTNGMECQFRVKLVKVTGQMYMLYNTCRKLTKQKMIMKVFEIYKIRINLSNHLHPMNPNHSDQLRFHFKKFYPEFIYLPR